MNQKLKKLVMLATVVGLPLAMAGTIQAQTPVLEKLVVTLNAYKQGDTVTNRAGTEITTAAPVKKLITTANLISNLSVDIGLTAVPHGASLDYNATTGDFQLDYGTNQMDVSSIFSFTYDQADALTNGTYSVSNGSGAQPYSLTTFLPVTLSYSGSTSGLSFTVTGLGSVSTTVPAANSHGKYKQSGTISFSDGTGTAVDQSGNIQLLSGFTISGSGSANETNSP